MTINHNNFDDFTQEELENHSNLINSTIKTLIKESHSSSKTKSNQAADRLDVWEKKKLELYIYMNKNNKN